MMIDEIKKEAMELAIAVKQRLTAIEERLDRLESATFTKKPEKLEGRADVENKIEHEPITFHPIEFDPVAKAIADKLPTPRICPVTGMFLDEPVDEFYFVTSWLAVSFITRIDDPVTFQALVEAGNCFATREDAERYAKHLKAMAKLRRLGGVEKVYIFFGYDCNSIKIDMPDAAYGQLTPEEQNALMWPNEEK
jgi:hypothetical protein